MPAIERHPLKKIAPDEDELLRLLQRWRGEARRAGRTIARIAVAYEAGRDGFWLARWRRARVIESYVVHPASVAVARAPPGEDRSAQRLPRRRPGSSC